MYFSAAIDLDLLCDAVSKHLFIPREDVGVVELRHMDQKKAAIVLQELDGDYPFGMNIYADLEWITLSEPEFARLLCRTLNATCLISDDGINPYRWLLVDAENIRPVFVDVRSFDDLNAFQVASFDLES